MARPRVCHASRWPTFLHVVGDYGSGYPSSSESQAGVKSEAEAEADSSLDQPEVVCRFFVVKYKGGCDFYSSHSEALDVFIKLSARKLAPKMRVTEDRSLVEEFMAEKF
ncbi:hypothetical protein VKT23_019245 [Stygiomarasmius scandens]|uniref:Uncharacterized protein n=1 Tax=Marasmiellus scandens TaxID=2682957 RepID=A0ABR1IM04_9AGAR